MFTGELTSVFDAVIAKYNAAGKPSSKVASPAPKMTSSKRSTREDDDAAGESGSRRKDADQSMRPSVSLSASSFEEEPTSAENLPGVSRDADDLLSSADQQQQLATHNYTQVPALTADVDSYHALYGARNLKIAFLSIVDVFEVSVSVVVRSLRWRSIAPTALSCTLTSASV
jgi:hypothetical protein